MKIQLAKGDITKLAVDAIVNAANSSLLGGGGVDGAIHRAAGPELLEECRALNGCNAGEAKITKGYRLPAKYVIHTVGPIWNGGKNREFQLLKNAYHNSLELARKHVLKTIAFPGISTGVYRFPKQAAAETAINTVNEFGRAFPDALDEVTFVCFDDENYQIYQALLGVNTIELDD
jgi:O-acetyl-ADP-ribose deacetylase (regulator of RNase III)